MASSGAPPLFPPPSTEANTVGHKAFIAIQAVFAGIAFILVMLRLYVRSFIIKNFGIDEGFIVIALIFSLATLAVTGQMAAERLASAKDGPSPIPPIVVGLKGQVLSQPFTIISVTCTRVSICFFLLRIFSTKRSWRWVLYSIMAFAVVTGVPTSIVTVTQCRPVEKQWNPMLPGKCWGIHTTIAIGDFYGAVSVLCDWALATLPIVFIWNVQMSKRVKIGICVLMSMGYFTGVCAIVKTVLLENVVNESGKGEVTWGLINLAIWAILEVNVGIIAATIPSLRPLFSRTIRESRSRSYNGRNSARGYPRKPTISSSSRNNQDAPAGIASASRPRTVIELKNIHSPSAAARTYEEIVGEGGESITNVDEEEEIGFAAKGSSTGTRSERGGGRPFAKEEEVFERI